MQFREDCKCGACAYGRSLTPDLKLGGLRREYPGVPIMALTATAQNKVQDDIIRTLGITGCRVLKQSFNRPNLHYEMRPKTKKVIEDMVGFINTQPRGSSGIIYCGSRVQCEDLAMTLREKHNLGAWHYHAGMSKGDRRKIQEGWQEHNFEIIVATVSPRGACSILLELMADCLRDGVSCMLLNHNVS